MAEEDTPSRAAQAAAAERATPPEQTPQLDQLQSGALEAANPCLPEEVRNAQILVAYAAERGTEIDEAARTVVARTAAIIAGGRLTVNDEVAFWEAYRVLAAALAPVSVVSLKATLDPEGKRQSNIFGVSKSKSRSLARRAVERNTKYALITLILLLVCQIYWVFGTSITGEIQKVRKETSDIDAKLRTLGKVAGQGADKKPAVSSTDPEVIALKASQVNLSLKKASEYALLEIWSKPWAAVIAELPKPDDAGAQEVGENIARFETALNILEVFQRYLLPLLYGLLGASVWGLRSLAHEIKARTYSEAMNIGLRIRLYLGLLGGMVFAWFITPESSDGLFKSISPFALAFLAGYSVELLFAAMDRFIAAFTGKTQA